VQARKNYHGRTIQSSLVFAVLDSPSTIRPFGFSNVDMPAELFQLFQLQVDWDEVRAEETLAARAQCWHK
jgi:hypothetical protein